MSITSYGSRATPLLPLSSAPSPLTKRPAEVRSFLTIERMLAFLKPDPDGVASLYVGPAPCVGGTREAQKGRVEDKWQRMPNSSQT